MKKYTFITGASRGIGYEIALFLAEKNENLILHARSLESLEKIKNELKKYNVDVILTSCNLDDIKDINRMLSEINVKVNKVVNNAGIQIGYNKDFLNSDYETFMP